MESLESDKKDFEIDPVRYRQPMQLHHNTCDVFKFGQLDNQPGCNKDNVGGTLIFFPLFQLQVNSLKLNALSDSFKKPMH